MPNKKKSINPMRDVLDVISQLDEEERIEVISFAKMLKATEDLKISPEDRPTSAEWEKTPYPVKALLVYLYDRFTTASGAYRNLLKDWEVLKNGSKN